jgi:rare lipoprotein A
MSPESRATPPTSSTGGSFAMAEEGIASYYADEFNGRKTSNGEVYDMNDFTAAHQTLPFNTRVQVTNIESGKAIVVRINDRGPFKGDRIIDLSLAAAKAIEMIGTGTARVRVQVLELGDTVRIR